MLVDAHAGVGAWQPTLLQSGGGRDRPAEAVPGSVRHDFGLEIGRNLTHASDGPETAVTEISLWFSEGELLDWKRDNDRWIYED